MKTIKTIQIAPKMEQIKVSDDGITTDWNGGITYKADLREYREYHYDEQIKQAFWQAIVLAGKPWILELLLNQYLNTDGKII